MLANTDYLHRHDQVAKIIHQKLAYKNKLIESTTPYYKYTPQVVHESDETKLYFDRGIITDKTIFCNRTDITMWTRKIK